MFIFPTSEKYGFSLNYCNNFFDFYKAGLYEQECVRRDFMQNCSHFLQYRLNVHADTAIAITNSLFYRMLDTRLHYHTPVHILSMFLFAQVHNIELEDWERLAIWFHDAIYNPQAKLEENEAQSAAFMRASIPGGHDATDISINLANTAILYTAKHASSLIDIKFHRVMDLDLCSLGWEPEAFEEVTDCIRREFAPGLISFKEYTIKRKEFFNKLLQKGYLYRTSFFHNSFDTAARRNLRTILKSKDDDDDEIDVCMAGVC